MTDILLEPPTRGHLLGEPDDNTPYHLTTPEGKRVRHHRSSGIGDILDDPYILHQYELRQVAHGVGLRPDLATLAATHPIDDKPAYRDIIATAKTVAADGAKANIGTAIHKMVEDWHRGMPVVAAPGNYQPYLHKYANTIERLPLAFDPNYLEQVIIYDDYRIAGKFDAAPTVTSDTRVTLNTGRRVELTAGTRVVLDLKTGNWMSELKWGVQLAIYANHQATWHPADDHPHGGTRGERLDVSRDVGLIIHLPQGATPPECIPYWIDLAAGYDAFLCAYEAHGHRNDAKTWLTPWVDHIPTAFDDACATWARERLAVLTPDAADTARRLWPFRDNDTGHPIRYPDQPTPEQTRALLAVLDQVEAEHKLPLTPPPGKRRNTNTPKTTPKETP